MTYSHSLQTRVGMSDDQMNPHRKKRKREERMREREREKREKRKRERDREKQARGRGREKRSVCINEGNQSRPFQLSC